MSRPTRVLRISRIATWALCAIAWEVFALASHQGRLFPTLQQVAAVSLPEIALFGAYAQPGFLGAAEVIASAAGYTMLRIAGGVTLGSILGLICAAAAYFVRANQQLSRTLLAVTRGIPLLALIPLFMFWFGDREIGMYLYIAFGVFIVISAVLYESFCSVPRQYIHQARLLGANRLQVFALVELPAIQPQLFSAVREAIGLSWAFSLGAEYLTANTGLGYLVTQSYLYSDMGKLFIMASIYCLLAYVTYLSVAVAGRFAGEWYLTNATGGLS